MFRRALGWRRKAMPEGIGNNAADLEPRQPSAKATPKIARQSMFHPYPWRGQGPGMTTKRCAGQTRNETTERQQQSLNLFPYQAKLSEGKTSPRRMRPSIFRPLIASSSIPHGLLPPPLEEHARSAATTENMPHRQGGGAAAVQRQ